MIDGFRQRSPPGRGVRTLLVVALACVSLLSLAYVLLFRGVGSGSGSSTADPHTDTKLYEGDTDTVWTRERVGHVTWSFLHLHAANANPEAALDATSNGLRWLDSRNAVSGHELVLGRYKQLLATLADIFVCVDCRNHFQATTAAFPLDAWVREPSNLDRLDISPDALLGSDDKAFVQFEKTREMLSLYLCDLHNVVNKRLGKTLVDCTVQELDRRWVMKDKQPRFDSFKRGIWHDGKAADQSGGGGG